MITEITHTIASHIEQKSKTQVVVARYFEKKSIIAACERRVGITDTWAPLIQLIEPKQFSIDDDDLSSCGGKVRARIPYRLLRVDTNHEYGIASTVSALRTLSNVVFINAGLVHIVGPISVTHDYEAVFERLFNDREVKYSDKVHLSLYEFTISAYLPINCLPLC